MQGSSRRNAGEEETPREGEGSMVHLTKDELQRMIEEASKNAIVEYERRTTIPVEKETTRRQLFENRPRENPENGANRNTEAKDRFLKHVQAVRLAPKQESQFYPE
ncbi:UNVERIFIED_CONTAM: hypothetical protein Sindi_2342700 [Sesamum indicum]